jgi:hypothetical protein
MKRWHVTIKVGVFWDGPTYTLCTGPQWWCYLRARLHLFRYPLRVANIAPINGPCAPGHHEMVHVGGCNAGCDHPDCECSVPVYECRVCKACDYGDNEEAADIMQECRERRA